MRKLFSTVLLFHFFMTVKAQIVFCPPGAEWHHSFTMTGFNPAIYGTVQNHTTKYIKDSIVGTDTVKVLQHIRFFKQCNYGNTPRTLIKQKGDTIFMKSNRTFNSWQILYNFAAVAGNNWKNSLFDGINGTRTYTITVDSVKYINVNSFTLKQLVVKYNFNYGPNFITSEPATITERFGCNHFLFNYYNLSLGSCDYDYFTDFLCYEDSTFGLKQFTNKPCTYNIPVGINSNLKNLSGIKLFPNPANSIINIESESFISPEEINIRIGDILGRTILKTEFKPQLDLKELKPGIYFLQLYKNEKLIVIEKIVKE